MAAFPSFERLHPGRFVVFSFPDPSSDAGEFLRVAVLDSPASSTAAASSPAAGLLVPSGRESDWLFCTEAGQLQLLLSSSASRLVLVGRHPRSDSPPPLYVPPPDRHEARERLAPLLKPLLLAVSPRSAFDGRSIPPEAPFLRYEDELDRVELVEVAVGPVAGEMLVEDVEVEGGGGRRDRRRRMRFKRMPNLVQTQMRLLPDSTAVDTEVLIQPYLAAMVAGLLLLLPGGLISRRRTFCLGVGGGALLTFLQRRLGFDVTGFEADETVLDIAKRHFGLVEGEFLKVAVGNALSALYDLSPEFFPDAIMVDLDGRDPAFGAVAPPSEFDKEIVARAGTVLRRREGVLAINVIPPSGEFYEALVGYLREEFSEVYRIDVGNGENVALFGCRSRPANSPETLLRVLGDDSYARAIRKI